MAASTAQQDTVYQSLYEPPANEGKSGDRTQRTAVGRSPSDISHQKAPAVRRRESNRARQNIKQRLSNIISWYIPDNNEEDSQVMLQIQEEEIYEEECGGEAGKGTPFVVKNLFNLEKIAELKEASILSVCHKDNQFYICIAGKSSVYHFSPENNHSIEEIPLRLGKTELFAENIAFSNDDLYVSGYFMKQGSKFYLMAIFRNGIVVTRTKPYPYPYFKHFTFDQDDNILVCSPQTSEDQTAAKVFKLSADFSRKSYFIKLGNQRVVYRPESVASHVAGDRGWISVRVQPAHSIDKENNLGYAADKDSDKSRQRRLISFTCCKPDNLLKPVETKEWLKVESWNFEKITPGLIMAFDQRLLVVDDIIGNLHYLEWSTENKPIIKPISKPGASKFIGMTKSKEWAYLFSEKSIFQFQFKKKDGVILEKDS